MSNRIDPPGFFAGVDVLRQEELRREVARMREMVQPELDRMREECDQRVAAMELTLTTARRVHAELLSKAFADIRSLTAALDKALRAE